MIKLGEVQELEVKRHTSVGVYLNERGEEKKDEDVLLPKKYAQDLEDGDLIDVFIYKDNKNRPVASRQIPYISLNTMAILRCVDAAKIGAFLDWGLDKDLFLPFEEQLKKVKVNDRILVRLYIDKSSRLCASMKVKDYFPKSHDFKENDWVEGEIYAINPDIGAFVLVGKKYDALLPKDELESPLKIGDEVRARVSRVKKDGKLDLSLRNRVYEDIHDDAMLIYRKLQDNMGFLRVNDSSNPLMIKRLFGISKSQFKRAIGHLLKTRKIKFEDDGIAVIDWRKNGK